MMVNCVDLEAISKIFKLLCICLTSEYCNYDVETAREALTSLISNKPNLSSEVKKRIDAIFTQKKSAHESGSDSTDSESDSETTKADDLEKTYFLSPKNPEKSTKTLKGESLFTKHFEYIRKQAEDTQEKSKGKVLPPKNPLYNPLYIDFLMKYFMPFCGVWAGFCFVNLTDEEGEALTRITNGIIERFWGYRKKGQTQLAQTPINYSNNTLEKTRGQARIFIKEMRGEVVSTDTDSSDSDKEDELDEYKHKEG